MDSKIYRVTAVFLTVLIGAAFCQDDLISLCKKFEGRIESRFIRDQRNCSVFYSCSHPIPRLFPMSCGWTTVFSQSQQVCVNKNSMFDDCKKDVYEGTFHDPLCGPRPFGLNRDPADCNRFIPCFNHTSYPSMACQDGLHFSIQEQRCVEPGKTDCRTNPVNNGNYNNNNNYPGSRSRFRDNNFNPADTCTISKHAISNFNVTNQPSGGTSKSGGIDSKYQQTNWIQGHKKDSANRPSPLKSHVGFSLR